MNKDWDELTLNSLRIHELRDLARKIGVKCPTALRKEDLVSQSIKILNGEKKPYKALNKKGRPTKGSNQISTLMEFFMPNDVSMDANINYVPQPENDFDFCAAMPEVEYNATINETQEDTTKVDVAEGLVEVIKNGFGIIRVNNFEISDNDVFIHESVVSSNNLKTGDFVVAHVKIIISSRPRAVVKILNINNNIVTNLKTTEQVNVKSLNLTLKQGENALVLCDELNTNANAQKVFEEVSNKNFYTIYAGAFEKDKLTGDDQKIYATVGPFKNHREVFCCYNMAINRANVISQTANVVLVISLLSAYYKAIENTMGETIENQNKLTTIVKEQILKMLETAKQNNITLIIFDSLKNELKIKDFLQYELSKTMDNFI